MIGLFFFIRSPWGQDIIIQKATKFVSNKTGSTVSIEKLFITFGGNIFLKGLYIEDLQGDTLVYSRNLVTGIDFLPLIREGNINISKLDWEGLVANISRDSVTEDFNFGFLIDAFVSPTDSPDLSQKADTEAAFPSLSFGPVNLKNVNLKYDDQVLGIDFVAKWKEIQIDADRFDLNKMDFGIQNVRIDNANITYLQTHAFPPSEEADTLSDSPLPLLVLDKVEIHHSKIEYTSIPDGISSKMDIGDFLLSLPEANFEENKILLKSLALSDSKIDLRLSPDDSIQINELNQEPEPFLWPEWWVEVGSIKLDKNEFNYYLGDAQIKKGVFTPEAISLSELNVQAHSLFFKDQEFKGVIDILSFSEGSGLVLQKLQAKLQADDKKINLSSVDVQTGKSLLKGDFLFTYQSLDAFIRNPEKTVFDIRLNQFETDASEALFFVPEYADETYFKELGRNGIKASGTLSGNMRRIRIPRFDFSYGNVTNLRIRSAGIENAADIERLKVDLPNFVFETKGAVIETFLEFEGYNIPDDIRLTALVMGDLEDLRTEIFLETSDGNASLEGSIKGEEVYFVQSTLDVQDLDLGKILELPQLQPISLVTNLEGKGSGWYDLDGIMKVDFGRLAWADIDLSKLGLSLAAKDTVATLQAVFSKDYIDFDFLAKAKIDSVSPGLDFLLDVKELNTKEIGITKQEIHTNFKIAGFFSGKPEDLTAGMEIYDGEFHLDRRDYPIGLIKVEANLSEDLSDLRIQSDFLKGFFTVNSSVSDLSLALEDYFNQVIVGKSELEEKKELVAESEFKFHPTPFIDQLLLADIDKMDTLLMEFGFNSALQKINAKIRMPHLLYLNAGLDTFKLDLYGDTESLNFDVGFDRLFYDPLNMGKTKLHADFKDQKVNFAFNSIHRDETVINFASQLTYINDTVKVRILPEDLIFNKQNWTIPSNNLVTFAPRSVQFKNLEFTLGEQYFGAKNDFPGLEEEHLGLAFSNFTLHTVLGFLNPDNPLANGVVNGNFITVNPFHALGFIADLNVSDFEFLDVPLGVLDVKAKAMNLQEYDFNLALRDGKVDLDIFGSLMADSASTSLDLDVKLKALKMSLLEILSEGALKETKGYITGDFEVKGSVQDPIYKGTVAFKDAGFLVSQLNTSFIFPDELIKIDNQGVYFSNFTIKDAKGAAFVTNGKVITENLADVGFDLKLKTTGFQVMNSTRKDSDLFFGKANIDLDFQLGGTVTLPFITMQLKVNEGSEVSFIVPEDRLDLVERTGVVIFVNHQDPYDLIYQREGDLTTQGIKGYDVKANLQIDPKSVFNLIVDERTNDNLKIQGQADLNILMNPNGDISMSGRYEVKNGHYEMNLFGLVNRRFELAPGSTVIWRGDPMDASLDLTAIYNIRTSAAELMQAQLSGTDKDTKSQFRQVLPFMVYLNIEGELLKPEISFELDLAEQERGAFGGSVYGMIQQINEQEDELTKQVFSLLVLNQFFPVVGNDGSGGGSVNLARSSVSQVLSSQLNALSGKLFGDSGFTLDFDLDSYTDFQTGAAQDRTQLNVAAKQSLMDDRLVISVGGQVDVEGGNQEVNQGDALFGDVSVEYLLDQRGQWRAKAYRKNQFESVIDGQLVITGISLIFNKEFNAFKELWRKAAMEAVKKEEIETTEVAEEKKENDKLPQNE